MQVINDIDNVFSYKLIKMLVTQDSNKLNSFFQSTHQMKLY